MRTFAKYSPIDGSLLDNVKEFSAHDVDKVLHHSRHAQGVWTSLSAEDRSHALSQLGAVLTGHQETLTRLLHLEQGKPDAAEEVEMGISLVFKAAEKALHLSGLTREVGESETHRVVEVKEPLGVVAAILPWNYPVYLALDKISRALLFGNAIVIKPSPHTPLTAVLIAQIASECERVPGGLIQVVTGSDPKVSTTTFTTTPTTTRTTTRTTTPTTTPVTTPHKDEMNLGQYLCEHSLVDKITFVGSTATGVQIRQTAARHGMKRVTLEMGGNDPALVLPDAEVETAARGVAEAALVNNGQICIAVKRVYVHEDLFDEFVSKVVEVVEAKDVGKDLGPMNNKMQYDKVIDLIEDALINRGKIVTGGVEPPVISAGSGGKSGLYIKPTVIVGLDDDVRLVKEEQFGPVIPILMYRDVEDAVRRCNATKYGLGASVWGLDVDRANEVAARLEAGMVWVNEHGGNLMDAPQGGVKMSGLGREGDWGAADIQAYTESKVLKLAK